MADKCDSEMEGIEPSPSVTVSVESTTEWKIHDILFDGTERYLKPLTFTDNVAKLSRKIDWQKLIDDDSSMIQPNMEDEDEEIAEQDSKEPQLDTVGPWDNVAKNLHQALVEMNVMLDVLQIGLEGKYMTFDPVDSFGTEAIIETNKMQLGSIFAFKKKVMSQGQKIFERHFGRLMDLRQVNARSKDSDFQAELIELRKAWRLKKLGNTILGDLSFKTYGSKFKPNATFEVRKSTEPPTAANQHLNINWSALEVVLPKDLEQIAQLRISVLAVCQQGQTNVTRSKCHWPSDADAFRKTPVVKKWQRQLEMAQRTLLCRDLFYQLSKEASHLTDMCCMIKGQSIVINLPCERVLKIELILGNQEIQHAVLDDADIGVALDEYAVQQAVSSTFEMYCADVDNAAAPIPPRLTSAPLTFGSRKMRTAGADALSVADLAVEQPGDQLLLLRLYRRACHASLVSKCRYALSNLSTERRDPLIAVQWCPESTGTWSYAKVSIMTPYYESCNRTFAAIDVDVKNITLTLKDGDSAEFGSNVGDLIDYIKLLADQHLVSAAGVLARHLNWHSLSCSLTNVDLDGRLEPSLLIGNASGTRFMWIKVPSTGDPKLSVKCISEINDRQLDHVAYSKGFRLVHYRKMTGKCFLHKLELLISAFS